MIGPQKTELPILDLEKNKVGEVGLFQKTVSST
jgi:hypothetical protein